MPIFLKQRYQTLLSPNNLGWLCYKNIYFAPQTICSISFFISFQSIENRKFSSYGRESILKVVAAKSGQYSCQACNDIGCTYHNIPFFVTDIANNGFSGKNFTYFM